MLVTVVFSQPDGMYHICPEFASVLRLCYFWSTLDDQILLLVYDISQQYPTLEPYDKRLFELEEVKAFLNEIVVCETKLRSLF